MRNKVRQWWDKLPAKGGLMGAILGAVASSWLHNQNDKAIKNVGKTALFSSIGFLAGQWLEKFYWKK
jgi:hypothetical protein